MNAITITKQTMALGAVLVAVSVTTNTAQATDFNEFTAQARARVLSEATSQPSASARVEELRGALRGVRVVDGPIPAAGRTGQALATIRSEQLAEMRAGALDEIDRSMDGVRLVKRLPSPDRRIDEALATIRAEQLEAMHRRATGQISTSLANAHLVGSVTLAGANGNAGSPD